MPRYALDLLTKFFPDRAEPFLRIALLDADRHMRLQALRSINLYDKAGCRRYEELIRDLLGRELDGEHVGFIGYLLQKMGAVRVADFQHLFSSAGPEVHAAALYASSHDDSKGKCLSAFFENIISPDAYVAHAAIQALGDGYDPAVLPYLEIAWQRFPKPVRADGVNIRRNIRAYLKKRGVALLWDKSVP